MNLQTLCVLVTRRTMLFCVYLLVAAAAFCNMYAKHGFGDSTTGRSIAGALDGTAAKPYVYRQLLPALANLSDALLPARAKARFIEHLEKDAPVHNPLLATFARASSTNDLTHALRYYVVYYLAFSSLLGAMLLLRIICLDLTGDEAAATLTPLVLALVFPAGNYQDYPALLFMTLAVWISCRASPFWLIPLAAVATFNQEAFPFFVVTLYPFLRLRASRRGAGAYVGIGLVAGVLVDALVKFHYAANAGTPMQLNLPASLPIYSDSGRYFSFDWAVGVALPGAIGVLLLALLLRTGWRGAPACTRNHALLAAAFSMPLLLVFGVGDETSAFSMLDVSATLLLCVTASGYLSRVGYKGRAATAHEAAAATAAPPQDTTGLRGAQTLT
jgi:hypothetical protein